MGVRREGESRVGRGGFGKGLEMSDDAPVQGRA